MDQLGYWACWFAEHHFAGYALVPDSLLMAAAAARETRRIRLGTGVVVLPFQHHPIRVVEQAAMVDCLSDGRLELGLGRGLPAARVPRLRRQARGEPGALRPGARRGPPGPGPAPRPRLRDAALPGAPGEHLPEARAEPDPLLGGVDQRGVLHAVRRPRVADPDLPGQPEARGAPGPDRHLPAGVPGARPRSGAHARRPDDVLLSLRERGRGQRDVRAGHGEVLRLPRQHHGGRREAPAHALRSDPDAGPPLGVARGRGQAAPRARSTTSRSRTSSTSPSSPAT